MLHSQGVGFATHFPGYRCRPDGRCRQYSVGWYWGALGLGLHMPAYKSPMFPMQPILLLSERPMPDEVVKDR